MTKPYKPNPHTVAAKVLAFFEANPSEELTVIDIACKFDTSAGNVRAELAKSIDAGLLVLARNNDLEPVYGAGPALPRLPAKRARPAKAAAPKLKPRFTPGPWSINHAGRGSGESYKIDEYYVYAPECGVDDVAICADIVDPKTGDISMENARLIASAPDMFGVLVDLQQSASYWSEYDVPIGIVDRINAVIANAIGCMEKIA